MYHPDFQVEDYINLIFGTVELVASAVTLLKVYKGSQNSFCYIEMIFAMAFGITNIGLCFADIF